jgi:glycosyltransferase involved in cell wall biosynthesis
MVLSVVIPTFNRAEILRDCLEALLRQDLPADDFEIIVIDDGSRDETRQVLGQFSSKHNNIRFFHQKNQGQGIARNLGIQNAHGNIIVLIGDDIIVKENFLSEHLRYHLRHEAENEAVLGLTLWHPKLHVTPFMAWLTNGSSILGRFGGHQFAYEKLEGGKEPDYNFFYTSNISLKRSLLDKYPFDPSFSGYGWEDIELGYRLHLREGLRLYYNPEAIGYHDHMMTEASLADRMRNIGKSAWVFHKRYPELKKVPGVFKKTVFRLLSLSFFIRIFKHLNHNFYYYALSKKYFLEGLAEGLSRQ